MFDLPKRFPCELYESAISLQSIGLEELAWKYEDAKKVAECLCSQNYAILGGDVYSFEKEKLVPTYDNWYFEKEASFSKEEYILKSKERAILFINSYSYRHGKDYYYALVYEQVS
jgi:hypothetical protein